MFVVNYAGLNGKLHETPKFINLSPKPSRRNETTSTHASNSRLSAFLHSQCFKAR